MKLNKIQILIIILLLYHIINEEIEIKNFVKYFCNDETLKYVYHFKPNIYQSNDYAPYFFFGTYDYYSNRILIYEEN